MPLSPLDDSSPYSAALYSSRSRLAIMNSSTALVAKFTMTCAQCPGTKDNVNIMSTTRPVRTYEALVVTRRRIMWLPETLPTGKNRGDVTLGRTPWCDACPLSADILPSTASAVSSTSASGSKAMGGKVGTSTGKKLNSSWQLKLPKGSAMPQSTNWTCIKLYQRCAIFMSGTGSLEEIKQVRAFLAFAYYVIALLCKVVHRRRMIAFFRVLWHLRCCKGFLTIFKDALTLFSGSLPLWHSSPFPGQGSWNKEMYVNVL